MIELTAYVTITIPVGLSFDKPPTAEEIQKAALDNFLNHPAIDQSDPEQCIDTLAPYLDKITTDIEYRKTARL